ncbi:MAG: hypothetical protein AB8B36_14540, partial [Prochlorococcus sp.]
MRTHFQWQKRLRLILSTLLLPLTTPIAVHSQSSVNWQPVAEPTEPSAEAVVWSPVPADADSEANTADSSLEWQALPAGDASLPPEVIAEQNDPDETQIAQKIPEPTYGGFRDLYRSHRWYPSISTIVPMGYGPQGVMAGFGFNGSDCTIESKACGPTV